MEEVTGRDNQIICQALQIAIPIMLKHSMSASNTFDMLRILDARGNRSNLKLLDTSVREFLEKIIDDIEKGNTLAKEKKSKNMCRLTPPTAVLFISYPAPYCIIYESSNGAVCCFV